MKMQSRKIWYYRITLIILLFAVLLAWALLPGVHEFINRSVAAFAAVDQQGIERFIQSYGALAAVVSFLLMILQAIAAPLPAFLITFANASLFGAFWGGLLSWTSSMAGAALCFFIARVMGREVVEKLTGKTVLDSMDGFFHSLRQTHHPGMSVIAFCPFRSNQLCCRFDFNTFSLVFYRHRAWSITGDYCLFLGGQHVNRRYFLVCHRTVYSVCPDRGDFYGEENMA